MILNGLTQFSLASATLRFLLCGVMIGVAISHARRNAKSDSSHSSGVLVTMLALLIGSLALLSWPLYFATLQSYVDQWPGTMCIYGVLHVGGNVGSARWLPLVAEAVIWVKPLLALLLGCWWVAHLINRGTREGQLGRTVLGLALALGLLSGVDAALEGGYLLLPKRQASPAPGCCVVQFSTAHSEPGTWSARLQGIEPSLATTLFFVNTLAIAWAIREGTPAHPARGLNALTFFGLLEFPLAWFFASRTLTPVVLRDAGNLCAYDLLPLSPKAVAGGSLLILAVILLLCGRFATTLARRVDDPAPASGLSRRLFRTASVCLLISAVLMALCLL